MFLREAIIETVLGIPDLHFNELPRSASGAAASFVNQSINLMSVSPRLFENCSGNKDAQANGPSAAGSTVVSAAGSVGGTTRGDQHFLQ